MNRRQQLIDASYFQQKDLGNGMTEVTIRIMGGGMNAEPLTGNAARKRWIRYILATASSLLGHSPEEMQAVYEHAVVLCTGCEREYELLSSGLHEKAH